MNMRHELRQLLDRTVKKIVYNAENDCFDFQFDNGSLLKVNTYMRIFTRENLILTSHDLYVNSKHVKKTVNIKSSLLHDTVKKASRSLCNIPIRRIKINQVKDVKIEFYNKVTVEIIINCLARNYAYYELNKGSDSIKAEFDSFKSEIVFVSEER